MDGQTVELGNSEALALAAELRPVIGRLSRRLREQSHLGELTLSQVSVLGRLDRDGPATVTSLARAEGMRQQSMGANVAALLEAGLVSGTPDPSDGRQTILSLTEKCREWIRVHRAIKEDWLYRAIQQTLSLTEQRDLAVAVDLLRRITEFEPHR